MLQAVRTIFCLLSILVFYEIRGHAQGNKSIHSVDFYGTQITVANAAINLPSPVQEYTAGYIQAFYDSLSASGYQALINPLLNYKKDHQLEDWLYYQLVRRTTEQISPKANNYFTYTLYKWFLMLKSGYDVVLRVSKSKILFYIKSNDNIYNIPQRVQSGRQYVCLNYHDYQNHPGEEEFVEISSGTNENLQAFSYKITRLPEFAKYDFLEKNISFEYNQRTYNFKVMYNAETKNIFKNYPVVDYEYFCNIPLSRETYTSLIPILKKHLAGLTEKQGIDYLMRFTRYGFGFERDLVNFGQEKRLSPEQTLLNENSDCEDRVALFFYLVKEIYNLPMIVLAYPNHVTIAVKFQKPLGKAIMHNGVAYTVCEPTPQKKDLNLGQLLPELKKARYEVAYVYTPKR